MEIGRYKQLDITDFILSELNSALSYANKTEPSTLTEEDVKKYLDEVATPLMSKALGWNEKDTRELERIYGEGEINENS